MDKDIKEYREKHPSCKWCKHHSYKNRMEWFWEECELSEKSLNKIFNKIRAKFCKYYKVKENENEISINKGN